MAKSGKDFMGGLKDSSPRDGDRSMQLPKGPSVNADSTRSTTAPTPKTLGPREA